MNEPPLLEVQQEIQTSPPECNARGSRTIQNVVMRLVKKMDSKLLSKQKHEVEYVKRLARKLMKDTVDVASDGNVPVRVSSLKRICKYILGKR